MVCTLTLLEKR
jgi:beta-porphyranase